MGRRALESVPGIRMLGDFVWHDDQATWVLHCRIRAEVELGGPIPHVTDWYLHARDLHPYGQVVFYPAKVGGINSRSIIRITIAPGQTTCHGAVVACVSTPACGR